MKVVIEYVTVGTNGGKLTLTEDVSAMPRLPEIGENITINRGPSGLNRTYRAQSISWIIENTRSTLDTPGYEVTMIIHCQADTANNPTPV